MGKRPYVSFAEVKERVPLPDVLSKFGIAEGFTRKGSVLTGVCPLPDHKHGPSPNAEQFKVDRKRGVWLWHCFGDCQRGGDVIEFVKAMTGYDNAHARLWFAENFGDRLNLEKPKAKGEEKTGKAGDNAARQDAPAEPLIESTTVPEPQTALKPLRFSLRLDREVPYLRQRGVQPETIRRYGLGLCHKGVLAGYIAMPIYGWPDAEGTNPIGYLGRWPGDPTQNDRPRYKFPDEFPRNQVVYGLREALENTEGKPLIVVEGPFKVYHLVQACFPSAVATLGAAMSDEQAILLARTGRRIVLLFDGDSAGQEGMRSAAGKLITRAFVRVIKLPDGKEPDQLSADDLQSLLLV